MSQRADGRSSDELRPVRFVRDFQASPAGAVLAQFGKTRVLCAVSVVDSVPRWMREQNVPGGWLTSEYQMLPGATPERTTRESRRGGPGGRSSEIQRLVGRSLRMAVDLEAVGPRTLYVDCVVLDADGGTRCASICGGMVALEIALRKLRAAGKLSTDPLRRRIAAVSAGVVAGESMLDLCYEEDSAAEVDMNVVMTDAGQFIEVQGTAEQQPMERSQLDSLLELAAKGIQEIVAAQAAVFSPA